MSDVLDECARDLMDTVPQIFQSIRTEMRRGRGPDLAIPQFRTLRFIQDHSSPSLSDVAEHLTLTLPSVSKLVDGLVKQELVVRRESAQDRRYMALALTPAGEAIVKAARARAYEHLANTLASLSIEELGLVSQALGLLQPLFQPTSSRSDPWKGS
jgi:DNA-binding MarR family transcriptional regulator